MSCFILNQDICFKFQHKIWINATLKIETNLLGNMSRTKQMQNINQKNDKRNVGKYN